MNGRRAFLLGGLAGATGAIAAPAILRKTFHDKDRPKWAQEHYTNSFWLDSEGFFQLQRQAPLNRHRYTTDITIIGGGYTGMSTALSLAKENPDQKITLIDGATCGFGASGRNGGFCMAANYNAPSYAPALVPDARKFMLAGTQIIQDFSENQGVDCDFHPTNYCSVVRDNSGAAGITQKIDSVQKLGIQSSNLDTKSVQSYFQTGVLAQGAVFQDGSARIHPAKLALGVRRRLLESRVNVFEGTNAIRINTDAGITVETEYGVINTGTLVLATNAYTQTLGKMGTRYMPVVSHVIATAPLTDAQRASIGWGDEELVSIADNGEDYFYMQMTADNRIVIGGGPITHHYGSKLHSGTHQGGTAVIENFLFNQLWPQLQGLDVTHKWGGNVCITSDFMFSLGTLDDHPDIYYALGYSGEGVSTSFAAGKTIADLINKKQTDLTTSTFINRPLGYIPGEPLRSLAVSLSGLFM